MPSDVALQAALNLAVGLAFSSTTSPVCLSPRIVAKSSEHDRPEHAVEVTVTSSVESVTCHLPRAGRDWRRPGQAGEGGLGSEAARMRPGGQQLRRHYRSHAHLRDQLSVGAHQFGQLPLELVDFRLGHLCAPRRRPQGDQSGSPLRTPGALEVEASAVADQFGRRESTEPAAEFIRGIDEQRLELAHGLALDPAWLLTGYLE